MGWGVMAKVKKIKRGDPHNRGNAEWQALGKQNRFAALYGPIGPPIKLRLTPEDVFRTGNDGSRIARTHNRDNEK